MLWQDGHRAPLHFAHPAPIHSVHIAVPHPGALVVLQPEDSADCGRSKMPATWQATPLCMVGGPF
jgi:hypothetical protein